MMERVNAILRDPRFEDAIEGIERAEKGRAFCGHGMDHLLDVARIAYILNMESGGAASKETIYAAALLHDTGRRLQYEDGTPHERESARLAGEILPGCGFDESETGQILEAILAHGAGSGDKQGLQGLLRRADKMSRLCDKCPAKTECNWEIKNTGLEY